MTEELTKAQQALDNQTEPGPERTYAQQMLTRLQSKGSRIILRDLNNQNETELETGDLLKQPGIVFGADNLTIYFVGAPETETRYVCLPTTRFEPSRPNIRGCRRRMVRRF